MEIEVEDENIIILDLFKNKLRFKILVEVLVEEKLKWILNMIINIKCM